MTLLDEAKGIQEWIVGLRRQLHRHPELMYEEVEHAGSCGPRSTVRNPLSIPTGKTALSPVGPIGR